MKRYIIVLFTIGLFTGFQIISSQGIQDQNAVTSSSPVISRISVLSIHVCDTAVHDSVFHFLTDRLGLSVEYYPVKWADRMYAGVYAGNMFLEPCGPFSSFRYATDHFKAIFFGVNCESLRTIPDLAEDLSNRHIDFSQSESIEVTDSAFIRQNIYLAISSGNGPDKKRTDSLRLAMLNNKNNTLGIESIKEIRIGYPDSPGIQKWRDISEPTGLTRNDLWQINEDQTVRFVKSNIREVNAIVFKVRSLNDAKAYLLANNMLGETSRETIGIDKSKTFGLQIFLSEK